MIIENIYSILKWENKIKFNKIKNKKKSQDDY